MDSRNREKEITPQKGFSWPVEVSFSSLTGVVDKWTAHFEWPIGVVFSICAHFGVAVWELLWNLCFWGRGKVLNAW